MAMQPHAWMTSYLFDAWISHFITALGSEGGISHSNRHLLIFDGHSSHVTLQVVRKAAMAGLDIITLSSHTSHHLQPLDIAVFHPFKCAFRNFRDAWTLQHSKKCARKEDLCGWVCLALWRTLSPSNIEKGFRKIGIWPFNSHAVDDKMGPAEAYNIVGEPSNSDGEEAFHGDDLLIPEGEDKVPESQPDEVQFFMKPEGGDNNASESELSSDNNIDDDVHNRPEGSENAQHLQVRQMLELPRIGRPPKRQRREEVLVDYSQSIILTKDDYMDMMAEKERRKDAALKEKEARKLAAERKREVRQALKLQQEAEKAQNAIDLEALKAFKAKWAPVALRRSGQQLWDTMHSIQAGTYNLQEIQYIPPFCGHLPLTCRENQRYRHARMWAKKNDRSLLEAIPQTSEPSWVHRGDTSFQSEDPHSVDHEEM